METLPGLIRRSLTRPNDEAVVERVAGRWTATSSAAFLRRIENVALALGECGLEPGARVAIMSPNRLDWLVADFGTLFAGLVAVPIFPTQALTQVDVILRDSGAGLLFVDTRETAARLRAALASVPTIVIFDATGDDSLPALEARGEASRRTAPERAPALGAALEAGDLAVLIYTSGTTGDPKGVMLTHGNIASNVVAAFDYALGQVAPSDRVLSVLPFSHIYEHTIAHGYIRAGASYYICREQERLLDDLRDCKPVVMSAVPRLFERVLGGIIGRAKAEGGLRAKLVPWALAVGRERARAEAFGTPVRFAQHLQHALAQALVLRKIRPALGLENLRYFVSGSAPLHLDIALTFMGAGVPIIEGYGPTECSPVVTVNRIQDNRFGTVGRPIPGVAVKLAADGEVLVRGPNVMRGYWNQPGATADALDDGWYRTGDVGELDADGYLKIVDRKDELFKTSGGKFIAPARIESALRRSLYIGQVLVVGASRPHPAALIAPNWEALREELDVPRDAAPESIVERSDVRALFEREAREHTADLAPFEQVRRVAVLMRELSIESGDLSPTLKLRRRAVEARHATEIARLYDGIAPG